MWKNIGKYSKYPDRKKGKETVCFSKKKIWYKSFSILRRLYVDWELTVWLSASFPVLHPLFEWGGGGGFAWRCFFYCSFFYCRVVLLSCSPKQVYNSQVKRMNENMIARHLFLNFLAVWPFCPCRFCYFLGWSNLMFSGVFKPELKVYNRIIRVYSQISFTLFGNKLIL